MMNAQRVVAAAAAAAAAPVRRTRDAARSKMKHCVAVCCRVLQCVAVCCCVIMRARTHDYLQTYVSIHIDLYIYMSICL